MQTNPAVEQSKMLGTLRNGYSYIVVCVRSSYNWPIASVSERRDDQSRCIAEVLVAVHELGGDHLDHDIFVVPVIAHLTQPREVVRTWHLGADHCRHHIARCSLNHTSVGANSMEAMETSAPILFKVLGRKYSLSPQHFLALYICNLCKYLFLKMQV